jgi:HPt (histidine-containing phosphotransfer) domain-containing protein
MKSPKGESAINWDLVMTHVDGDRELLVDLAVMFIEDYPQFLAELRTAATRSDFPAVERIAHTLKGRVAFFGLKNAVIHAAELENMGRAKNLAGAWDVMAEMESALDIVLPELQVLSIEQKK